MEEIMSLNDDELYERMMRSASLIWECEAAVRLIFRTTALRRWMIEHGFVVPGVLNDLPIADVMFAEACDHIRELSSDVRRLAENGPGHSEISVLWVAASLWGADAGSLRHVMPDLEIDHARLVAEAMMYAAGFMDSTADPEGGEVEGYGTGPNGVAHRQRL